MGFVIILIKKILIYINKILFVIFLFISMTIGIMSDLNVNGESIIVRIFLKSNI